MKRGERVTTRVKRVQIGKKIDNKGKKGVKGEKKGDKKGENDEKG